MTGERETAAPRVLIVDDDRMLVPLLQRGLRFEGFQVSCAYDGAEALQMVHIGETDLVVLDIGMPDVDGLEVLRELRRRSDVPVVMLTARDDVADKVGALDAGADDYLAKPFAFDELLARIRAVLRRRGAGTQDLLCHGDLRLDLGSREVHRAGRPVELTATEFDVLTYLIRQARRVCTREALLRAVWGYDLLLESNVVDVHIGHLRRKLGPPQLIHTVRRMGYLLRGAP